MSHLIGMLLTAFVLACAGAPAKTVILWPIAAAVIVPIIARRLWKARPGQ